MDIVRPVVRETALEPAPVVGLKNAFAASKISRTSATPILLQGDAGGLYLYERSYDSFLAIAKRLLPNSVDKGAGLVFWFDFKRPDATKAESIKMDLAGGPATFEAAIKPLRATPNCQFRIRHDGEHSQSFKKSQYTGGSVRLNHMTIGYAYVAVDWVDEPVGNSEHGYASTVMVEAISLLFPETTRRGFRFTLVIRGEGSHDVDLRNGRDGAVKARVQAILHRLTKENKGNADPVEVQIYESAHPPFDVSSPVPSPVYVTNLQRHSILPRRNQGPALLRPEGHKLERQASLLLSRLRLQSNVLRICPRSQAKKHPPP